MDSEKEIQNLKNRFRDLAEQSFRQSVYTFTDFLGLDGQQAFWQLEKELSYAGCRLWGGYEEAERRVLRFGSEEEFGYDAPYGIVCIHIAPLAAKFAEELSHRDYLGALMNLGLERDTIGDIRTAGKEAYVFCLERVAEYICANLESVGHNHVKCEIAQPGRELPVEEPEELVIQVSSGRVDACISKVYNKSRSDVLELFRAGRVYVDGRQCENNARLLRPGESVNARGFGKFTYSGTRGETRKGKLCVLVKLYR